MKPRGNGAAQEAAKPAETGQCLLRLEGTWATGTQKMLSSSCRTVTWWV